MGKNRQLNEYKIIKIRYFPVGSIIFPDFDAIFAQGFNIAFWHAFTCFTWHVFTGDFQGIKSNGMGFRKLEWSESYVVRMTCIS